MKEAVELAEAVRDMGYMPEQVQDFYPTPSTMSTAMYFTCLLYTSARPPVQVAQHDEPAEDGNEAEQRQQHELAEPARGVLDILPSGVEVTGLHSDLLFLSVWHPL